MMWIWILLVIVLIVLLVPLFNRSRGAQTQPPTSSGSQKSAVEILELCPDNCVNPVRPMRSV
jgi:hypothetical protein